MYVYHGVFYITLNSNKKDSVYGSATARIGMAVKFWNSILEFVNERTYENNMTSAIGSKRRKYRHSGNICKGSIGCDIRRCIVATCRNTFLEYRLDISSSSKYPHILL